MTEVGNFIAGIDLPSAPVRRADEPVKAAPEFKSAQQALTIDSQLTEFHASVAQPLRSTISHGLLLGQLAADKVLAQNPTDQMKWFTTYNSVMGKIGWLPTGGEFSTQTVSDTNVSFHKAIIPVITAILGPAATAGSIILAALNGLKEMDKDSPWVTLFQKKSQTVTGAKFGMSFVDAGEGGNASLKTAYFSVLANQEIIQVLFFKVSHMNATLRGAKSELLISAQAIADTKDALQKRVAPFLVSNIENIDI